LRWSEDLARYARAWAEHLAAKGGPLAHSTQSGKARPEAAALGYRGWGENLYWSSAIVWSDGRREINRNVTPEQVVESWAGEERWYDFETGGCSAPPNEACGHFTQVVWNGTSQVGCGKAVGPDRSQIWACSYDPPGNYQGEYTWNVLPPGNLR
jgi:pathogenesis-related protein 1